MSDPSEWDLSALDEEQQEAARKLIEQAQQAGRVFTDSDTHYPPGHTSS